MNRYHVVHVTEFHYEGPVTESYNEVRLRPMHDETQSCISFRLTTTPNSRNTPHQDPYGNWVHEFNVLAPHRRLRIQAESVVLMHEVHEAESPLKMAELDNMQDEIQEEHYDFIAPTAYIPHLAPLNELAQAAENCSDGTVSGFARSVSKLIHKRFRYEKGATHVHSSVADALSKNAGVCQDFAHLLLGIVRTRGLPARYVSGYLVPRNHGNGAGKEQIIGGQASHAWTEVFIAGAGWMPLDPTLGTPVGMQHIRVAYGRDYADVAPVRGVYNGHAGQRLSVNVSTRPALDEEGNEFLNGSGGTEKALVADDRTHQPAQQ